MDLDAVTNNLSPLPFYKGTDLRYQNHRKDYAFGNIYPLICYRDMLLPFQIVTRESILVRNISISLQTYEQGSTHWNDITTQMLDAGLTVTQYKDFYIIQFPAIITMGLNLKEGRYYLVLSTGASFYYSDVFTVSNTVDDLLYIEYRNSYPLEQKNGAVDFSNNFMFKCYLNTQIGKPEYTFEEEVTERLGYQFVESQVSKKVYKFTFLAPEYLCDALRVIRLCDYKKIVSRGKDYYPMSFDMSVSWEEQGDLAAVECSFESDNVMVNIGGAISISTPDFNEDFNEDFNIE